MGDKEDKENDGSFSLSPAARRRSGVGKSFSDAVETDNSITIGKRSWSLDDFEIGKKLGKGTFGATYLVREMETKFIVCLKKINKEKVVNEMMVLSEVECQANLRHPNIIRIYGHFFDVEYIYLILEYAPGGELYEKLQDQLKAKKGPFDEKYSARLILDVADAVNYCHSKNIYHRDIKPENILIGPNGEAKLADFGWSKHSSKRRDTVGGTVDYQAPELIRQQSYNKTIDSWALGCMLYEFLDGDGPFYHKDVEVVKNRILRMDFDSTKDSMISNDAQDLIRKFLAEDPKKRITLEDVKHHRWIKRCLGEQK